MAKELLKKALQGLIFRGYAHHDFARYFLVQMPDGESARAWIRDILPSVTLADQPSPQVALHVAFSAAGLAVLGKDTESLGHEFGQGLRARLSILKMGESDWEWEGEPHLLVAAYTQAAGRLPTSATLKLQGMKILRTLDTERLPNSQEHFGFVDGISNPEYRLEPNQKEGLAPGELLLGYPNEDGETFHRSEEHWDGSSFLVFMQLAQNVAAFEKFVLEQVVQTGLTERDVRGKLIGRYPDGSLAVAIPKPSSRQQHRPGKRTKGLPNSFDFHDDPTGLKCPLGSHIRRANPRITPRHRILRRGRSYGAPYAPGTENEPRGLHFLCLNGDLSSQFELIQSSWLANPNFAGLHNETDPLMAEKGTDFTIPCEPYRYRLPMPGPFVRLLGGQYFLLPSLNTLELLSL